MQPLSGVRIIDVTHALAGPFCTHHLQLMGADVIKVEPPRGDDFRERPAPFAASNAGKRSVTVDLKTPEGRDLLMTMVAQGDVLVENYRPGVAATLGLDWASLKAVNPKLIYCSISGYGQSGPLKDMPAIESSVQAASGLLMAQMDSDAHQRQTTMLLLDPLTGYVAYATILAALLQREKTGVGQRLDVAMIDAALMISSVGIANLQIEAPPGPTAPAGMVGRPTVGRFRSADKQLFIAAVLPPWWGRVCDIIGRPELKDDPRFATPQARVENADALMREWEAGLAARPAEDWEAKISLGGGPAAVVRTTRDFIDHPHVVGRGSLSDIRVPGHDGPVRLMGAGVGFEHGGPGFQGDVPALGADTDAVLTEFGITPARVTELRAAGAI